VKAVPDAHHRWSVASRFIAASLGGYALVTLSHLAFTVVLPFATHQSMLFASQTGYLTWTAVFVWCFAARTARRAWLGLALIALPLLLIDAWALLQRGGA
jgi:hypothetical protein